MLGCEFLCWDLFCVWFRVGLFARVWQRSLFCGLCGLCVSVLVIVVVWLMSCCCWIFFCVYGCCFLGYLLVRVCCVAWFAGCLLIVLLSIVLCCVACLWL